jgi:hypothetical protein
VSNNSSIVSCVFVVAGTCLPSRCIATTGGNAQAHRQQSDIISLFLFFSNSRLRSEVTCTLTVTSSVNSGSDVLTEVTSRSNIVLYVTPCSLVEVRRQLGEHIVRIFMVEYVISKLKVNLLLPADGRSTDSTIVILSTNRLTLDNTPYVTHAESRPYLTPRLHFINLPFACLLRHYNSTFTQACNF